MNPTGDRIRLDEVRNDPAFIRQLLKANERGEFLCPMHDDHKPSGRIYKGRNGSQRGHCFPCGIDGDGFHWYGLSHGCTFAEATGAICGDAPAFTAALPRKAPNPRSAPAAMNNAERERLADLLLGARMEMESDEAVQAYLLHRRVISPAVANQFSLGAMNIRRGAGGAVIGADWIFAPLYSDDPMHLAGLKVHTDPARDPKCYWLNKGTPAGRLLFPQIRSLYLKPGDEIILTAGELKALSWLSSGYAAVSRMGGEGAPWPEGLAESFAGLRVILDPDFEDSKVARDFVKFATAALAGFAASIEIIGE